MNFQKFVLQDNCWKYNERLKRTRFLRQKSFRQFGKTISFVKSGVKNGHFNYIGLKFFTTPWHKKKV